MFILDFDRSLEEEGRWNRFEVRHDGRLLPYDLKIRPRTREEARRMVARHQVERREGGVLVRDIPPEKDLAFGMDTADYLIADWGGSQTAPPEFPEGPRAFFERETGELASYLPGASRIGIKQANPPDGVERAVWLKEHCEPRVWPLDKRYKWLLLQVVPKLDEQVNDFAGKLALSVTEVEEAERGN